MTVTIPESVTAEGNVKAVFVPALVSLATPSAAVLNGATAVDISCYLMPGWEGITGEQATGEDRRFCSKEGFDRLGRIKRGVAPLTYTYLPQEDDENVANAVKAALAQGNTGVLVMGYGIAPEDEFATGDLTKALPVECGFQKENTTGENEFSPLTITQTIGATGVQVPGIVAA